jgi:hypothetical protein
MSSGGSVAAREWALLFYVPYANDLWRVASSVFGSISRAFAASSKDPGRCRDVRVLMQYKLRGDAHMRRRHWLCDSSVEWADEEHAVHLHEEAKSDSDASGIDSFRSFLLWSAEYAASAEHVGVVIMGHGGGAMQFCPEEAEAGAMRWMDVAAAAAELTLFNASISQRIGFVFLQNCCKATLPALWPFRHLKCCLVASPTIIAAPNTYYPALISHLFTCPSASPASAAAVICNNEQPEDFAILSVFHAANLPPFVAALDAFAAAAVPLTAPSCATLAASDSLRCFAVEYAFSDAQGRSSTDCYVDVLALCSALYNSVPTDSVRPPLHALLQTVQVQPLLPNHNCASLITSQASFAQLQQLRVVSPLAGSYREFCGLSLLCPLPSAAAALGPRPSPPRAPPPSVRLCV